VGGMFTLAMGQEHNEKVFSDFTPSIHPGGCLFSLVCPKPGHILRDEWWVSRKNTVPFPVDSSFVVNLDG